MATCDFCGKPAAIRKVLERRTAKGELFDQRVFHFCGEKCEAYAIAQFATKGEKWQVPSTRRSTGRAIFTPIFPS